MSNEGADPGRPAALITGGAKRLGRAMAESLAAGGYDLALTYHDSRKEAEDLQGQLESSGRRCRLYRADLRNLEGLDALLAQILGDFPRLTLLVNNASIFPRRPFSEITPRHYREVMDLNLGAPILLTRAYARSVKTGHVVNLLDTRITRAASPYFIYLLAKKALADFTAMAASELGPAIRVNAIAPGLILPPEGEDEAYLDRMSQSLPLKRKGQPGEVVKALHYLIDNTYVTGEFLYVDGGGHL